MFTDIHKPRGLAVDYYQNDRLFWTDLSKNTLESCNMDGSDRIVVASDLKHQPYNLDVFAGYVALSYTFHILT